MAEKKAQMGDFIGFSFNGIHSSELGLVRVSDGNRYEKNLFPAISDKTVQVPGRDGFYYFGSSYNTREMTVKVAFDNLEENEFRRMTELFKDKKPHFLWFDELPYKEYLVKIKSPPNFKYLCFDEKRLINEDGPWSEENLRDARIYKGEGTIIFVCYSPYARARVKALNDPVDKVIVKHDENWPDWFDNYFLNGDNQIINYQDGQGASHEFPSSGHPYRNGSGVKDGQSIRNLYDTGYLELISEGSPILLNCYNVDEWELSSRIIRKDWNQLPESRLENLWYITNCGDIDMNILIKLEYDFSLTNIPDEITIELKKQFYEFDAASNDHFNYSVKRVPEIRGKLIFNFREFYKKNKKLSGKLWFDSKLKIVSDEYNYNEKEVIQVYNNYLSGGDFFKLSPCEYINQKNMKNKDTGYLYYIQITPDAYISDISKTGLCFEGVEYTYLYY